MALDGSILVHFPSEETPNFDFETEVIGFTTSAGSFQSTDIATPDRFSEATASISVENTGVFLSLTGYNVQPIAAPDSVTINEGDTVLVDVLANDFDPYGDTLSFTGVSATRGFAIIETMVHRMTLR